MSIMKSIRGRYLVIKGHRGCGRARAEALRVAAKFLFKPQAAVVIQAKPRAREYIERVEFDDYGLRFVCYRWINTINNVVGWYSEKELRSMRARLAAALEPPLAPGVCDEIRRIVAMIDDALENK